MFSPTMSCLMLGCVLFLVNDIYALLWLFVSSLFAVNVLCDTRINVRKCIHDVTASILFGVKWLNSFSTLHLVFHSKFSLLARPCERNASKRICWGIKVNENQCLALGMFFILRYRSLCLRCRWWKSYINDRIMMMTLRMNKSVDTDRPKKFAFKGGSRILIAYKKKKKNCTRMSLWYSRQSWDAS